MNLYDVVLFFSIAAIILNISPDRKMLQAESVKRA